MADILKDCIRIAEKSSKILDLLDLRPKGYYLATVHRAENTDDPRRLKSIIEALCQIDNVVFPCHPRTEKRLQEEGLWDKLNEEVNITKPVGYLEMLLLEKNAKKILTDSGGVQKEAYMLKVPCVTMRDETEWVETVEDGWNVLVGADKEKIFRAAGSFDPHIEQREMFGRGDASKRIVQAILEGITKMKS
jgi:UDP-N-acetylglucosamine 2-epimerase (non-hydrolysing)